MERYLRMHGAHTLKKAMCLLFRKETMGKIQIGKIVNAVALRGEVKVYSYSSPERYREIKEIFVGTVPHQIQKVRYQANTVILKLSGIDDRSAEACKGKDIYIAEETLPELPEGTYYIKDLIGMTVAEENGNELGVLSDVLQNTAQDIYEVKREGAKELLIPGVSEFIIEIRKEERKIIVRLPKGLLDL